MLHCVVGRIEPPSPIHSIDQIEAGENRREKTKKEKLTPDILDAVSLLVAFSARM